MKLTSKEIQLQYEGFLNTPFLWTNTPVYSLTQFDITSTFSKVNLEIDANLRLGKYVERFVAHQLQQEKNIQILAENIQIQKDKRTLGELDCVLLKNDIPIHLEIIYKFYLYDASHGTSEIEHFIGPNRKDTLVEKLTKLKNKQLPLLYHQECVAYLESLKLASANILQQVYFKAQLFVPFAHQEVNLLQLNQNCIVGFYLLQQELVHFKHCKFYIPNKKNWLVAAHTQVNWLTHESFKLKATVYMAEKQALLIWVKNPNGTLNKSFLVWW